MRLAVQLCLISAGVWAAPPQTAGSLSSPVSADKQELYRQLDEIRARIRTDDWVEAWRLSVVLDAELIRHRNTTATPGLELAHLEMMAGKDAISRAPLVARMAKAAFDSGDTAKAERYANEALEASRHGVFWWTGDAIHDGNTVLGRVALRRGDVESAKNHLLLAGKAPGSPSLGAMGPNLALAKELLDRGEAQTVLAYLEDCRIFWGGNRGKLAEWIALIRAGLKPDFGVNLTQ